MHNMEEGYPQAQPTAAPFLVHTYIYSNIFIYKVCMSYFIYKYIKYVYHFCIFADDEA